MKISFENNYNDIVNFAVYVNSTIYNFWLKTKLWKKLLIFLCSVFFLFYFVLEIEMYQSILYSLFLSIFPFRLLRYKSEDYLKRHYEKELLNYYSEMYQEKFEVDFNKNHIKIVSDSRNVEYSWKDIKKIDVIENYVFIFYTKNNALIIPKRSFNKPRSFTEFWIKVKQLRDNYKKGYNF